MRVEFIIHLHVAEFS